MDNPETLVTLATQDTGLRQSKAKTKQKSKTIGIMDPPMNSRARERNDTEYE